MARRSREPSTPSPEDGKECAAHGGGYGPDGHGSGDERSDHDATSQTIVFRPRSVRVFGYLTGVIVLAGTIFFAMIIPGFSPFGRGALIAVGLIALAVCHLHARVRLIAGPTTLTVHNLGRTRTVEWAQVVGVSYPMGDPWAHVNLADGTTLPTMALQRADGRRAVHAAHRLARLADERSGLSGTEHG